MSNFLVEAGLIIALPVILLLFFFSRKTNVVNLFLAFSIFSIWYTLLVNYMNSTEAVLNYPYLIRTANITAYLILPFLYIYTRNTFYPGIFWRKRDWIFLVPAFIYVIDMLPFFLSDSAYKIAVMKKNFLNPTRMFGVSEGWIGIKGFHFIFRYIWGLFIMSLQIRLIVRNWNFEVKNSNSRNRQLFWFIIIITATYIPLLVPGIFGVLLKLKWYSLQFINIDLACTLLVIAVFMLLSPHFLYGFRPPVKNKIVSANDVDPLFSAFGNTGVEQVIDTMQVPHINQGHLDWPPLIEKINWFMEQNKPFLNQGYTIHDLGSDIEIPVYQLSPIINNHFKANFSTWLNRYRVNYFIELCSIEGKRELTFDALSHESGFSNRVSFINAFKKEKGITPGAYLKDAYQPATG